MLLIQNISYMAELSIMTFAVVGFGFFNLTKSEATCIMQLKSQVTVGQPE